MTNRERAMNILKYQLADRMLAVASDTGGAVDKKWRL